MINKNILLLDLQYVSSKTLKFSTRTFLLEWKARILFFFFILLRINLFVFLKAHLNLFNQQLNQFRFIIKRHHYGSVQGSCRRTNCSSQRKHFEIHRQKAFVKTMRTGYNRLLNGICRVSFQFNN